MCPPCGGERVHNGRGWLGCACGTSAAPVCRGCAGDPFCGCGAGVRPRMVRLADPPEFRSMGAEVRQLGLGECRVYNGEIHGHAAVFSRASRNLGGFVEVIEPGAFDGVMSECMPVECRYNHRPSMVLGDLNDGRLNIWTDDVGLAYSVRPRPGYEWLLDAVRRRDVTSSSFAFSMLGGGEQRWGYNEQGRLLREVVSVGRLTDVAPVDDPAYPAASDVQLRMDPAAARRELDRKRGPLDPDTAARILDRKVVPPGGLTGREAMRLLERKLAPRR